ncbi:hypothetical protein [Azospirillum agricola]|uniref:hypothetical protein n=1 Tax=Azospirillum agricola TaxID=1720247 RepID=UPI000A0EF160|nr:hypothetical protein [Azospirillum agricola]SMH58946.1 hypothetical protein SAMN02982994_4822 [Azospirillum lipoferum]
MPSTIALPPEPDTGETAALSAESRLLHGRQGGRGTPFPDPQVKKLRGLRLIALWTLLTAGAWAVLGGAGYGLYVLVHSMLL